MSRILVVDDEQTFCDYFARYLTAQGFHVEHVYDGAEALARIEQNGFDVVISDIRMPGLDGLELLAWVKTRYPGAHTFLMSAFDVPHEIEKQYTGIFKKPFPFTEAVETLRAVLSGCQKGARSERSTCAHRESSKGGDADEKSL